MKFCPAIVNVEVLNAPVFAWTVIVVVPDPEPLSVLAVTQAGLPLTVHAHPAVVVTVTEVFPPPAGTLLKLDGLIV